MKAIATLVFVLGLLYIIVIAIPNYRMRQRAEEMNQMLVEEGVLTPEGELMPNYSGESN